MFSLEGIDNIIFDLGGVIVDIDPEMAVREFVRLGVSEAAYHQAVKEGYFEGIETGEVDHADLRNRLRSEVSASFTDKEIDAAWNALLIDLPQIRIDILLNLKSKYRTFLLSNTNQVHMEWMEANWLVPRGYQRLDDLFEKAYLSYEMGVRKPHAEIFQQVLQAEHLVPEKTLFIDDTQEHLDTAASLGIRTYRMPKENQLPELFRSITGIS